MPPPGHRFVGEVRQAARPGFATVDVRFDTRGLAIEEAGALPSYWPYGSLRSESPLPLAGTHRVVLTSTREPHTTLAVESDVFLASVLQAAPQLSKRRARGPSWLPMVVTSVATLVALGLLVWAVLALFPYGVIARRIPDETREKIGQLALQHVVEGRRQCKSAAGTAALHRLVERLARHAGTEMAFKVQVVDWDLVNAFAVMGHQIVLSRGLIQAASSPDEVAGVLGHEMGHAIAYHPETAVLRALGTTVGIQILLGGWTPDLVTGAASQALLLRHSRADEREADETALRLLESAGIAAGPFADFFDRISDKKGKGNGGAKDGGKAPGTSLQDVFATHPPPPERAERVRAQATYPATPALDAAEWRSLRQICAAS